MLSKNRDATMPSAECRVPSEWRVAAEALENLHIWFAVDSQVKFCVSFPPLLCYAVCLLGCLSSSFSILFAAFATHYEYWTEQFVNTIANKNATIERNQPFLYTESKVKRIIAFSLTPNVISKVRKGLLWIIIFRYHIYNDDYLQHTSSACRIDFSQLPEFD